MEEEVAEILLGANGLRMHVKVAGKSDVTCLMIHGFGEGAYVWRDLTCCLPGDWRKISVDLRGHGDSEWDPRSRYTTDDHLADLVLVLKKYLPSRLILIGHSLGGHLAIKLADRYQDILSHLVIVDFAPSLSIDGMRQAAINLSKINRQFESRAQLSDALSAFRPLASKAQLDWIAESSLCERGGALQLKMDPALLECRYLIPEDEQRNLSAILEKTLSAVLIVRGAGSAVVSRAVAHGMLEKTKVGTLAEIHCAGHAVMIDNPQGFNRSVLSFLGHNAA